MTKLPKPSGREYLDLPEPSAQGHEAGIYIHFPFCRYLCTYCDFDKFAGIERLVGAYVDATVEQIAGSPAARATSLYVGGGTPSIMSPGQADRLIGACRDRFDLPREAEATIEANPTDMSAERLEGFQKSGYNRLSVGIQSTNDRLLRLLGRRHSFGDAEAAIKSARAAGFDNVSVDLIYGVPMQDAEMWARTLDAVVGWGVEHVSCYMLTVEPGTPMERGVRRGTLQVPPDEAVVEMYRVAGETLGAAGFARYEISNWAKPGRQSSHNLTYWRNRPYLGIGAGAAGYWDGFRYKVAPAVAAYTAGVRAGRVPLSECDEQGRHTEMSNSLILGLRLAEGVNLPGFRNRFGTGPEPEFGEVLGWAEASGLLRRSDDRLLLTEQGILLSNELFERLL